MIVYNNRITYNNYHHIQDKYKNLTNYSDDLLKILCRLEEKRSQFFDRTGLLPNIFKLSYPNPFPFTNNYQNISFENIVRNRV